MGFSGSELDDEREMYAADPDRYRTPTACTGALLPEAGEGHTMIGCWPPSDVPRFVWDAVLEYHRADRWGLRDRDRDCSWTMARFDLMDSITAEIRDVKHEEAMRKAKGS